MKKIKVCHLVVFLFLINMSGIAQERPNIILILTDDQGYGDISAHGSPDVSTPNMDKLKSQSISLEDFQVSPTCAPTRSALMTGRHPFKNGITHTILERELEFEKLALSQIPAIKGGDLDVECNFGDQNVVVI